MQKTIFLPVISLIAGLCIGVVAAVSIFTPVTPSSSNVTISAAPPVTTPTPDADTHSAPLDPSNLQSTPPQSASTNPLNNVDLLSQAGQVVSNLRDRDYAALATIVHPQQGVIFTPYSTVDVNANLRFAAGQIASLESDSTQYLWGMADGSPIQRTMLEYFDRYVYNADYAQAPVLGIDQIIGSGNALENVKEVYPDAHFVEYHFPTLSPDQMGFDWCSLKLVFSEYEGEYRLIGIIHSEWTA